MEIKAADESFQEIQDEANDNPTDNNNNELLICDVCMRQNIQSKKWFNQTHPGPFQHI
jgi:hypothetical protein